MRFPSFDTFIFKKKVMDKFIIFNFSYTLKTRIDFFSDTGVLKSVHAVSLTVYGIIISLLNIILNITNKLIQLKFNNIYHIPTKFDWYFINVYYARYAIDTIRTVPFWRHIAMLSIYFFLQDTHLFATSKIILCLKQQIWV